MTGGVRGNVILRKRQYKASENLEFSLGVAKNCILGKIYNGKWVLERATRDHGLQVDVDALKRASAFMQQSLNSVWECTDMAQLRGMKAKPPVFTFVYLIS